MFHINVRSKKRNKLKTGPYFAFAAASVAAIVLLYSGGESLAADEQTAAKVGGTDNPHYRFDSERGKRTAAQDCSELSGGGKKVGPAVVSIKATIGAHGRRGQTGARNPHQEGPSGMDPFREFFERYGQPFPYGRQTPSTALGSGIIIDKEGYVVTNNHVVDGATDVLVMLDGESTELKATIVGTDPKTDLAVLKIQDADREFPSVKWADSDGVHVGDWAIAVGSPFSLGQSVTVGIVSATGGRNAKQLTGAEYGGDLIQTDAAINPGNSGGPLCDLDGNVMGVNTAIYTRSGGYMGIGFAIPSNLAKFVVNGLIADGRVVRGWLGVLIQPLDDGLAKDMGLENGVGIHEVVQDSPAEKGGLTAGDVIVKVDGKIIKSVTDLQGIISRFKPDQDIKIRVKSYRDMKFKDLSVKIGELPGNPGELPRLAGSLKGEADKLGLTVESGKARKGVEVQQVAPGSVADQVGLKAGDLIVSMNRMKMDSEAAYSKRLASSRHFYLEVERRGRTRFYQFSLPKG